MGVWGDGPICGSRHPLEYISMERWLSAVQEYGKIRWRDTMQVPLDKALGPTARFGMRAPHALSGPRGKGQLCPEAARYHPVSRGHLHASLSTDDNCPVAICLSL